MYVHRPSRSVADGGDGVLRHLRVGCWWQAGALAWAGCTTVRWLAASPGPGGTQADPPPRAHGEAEACLNDCQPDGVAGRGGRTRPCGASKPRAPAQRPNCRPTPGVAGPHAWPPRTPPSPRPIIELSAAVVPPRSQRRAAWPAAGLSRQGRGPAEGGQRQPSVLLCTRPMSWAACTMASMK